MELKNDIALVRESGLFDEEWYLAQYPDVQMVGLGAIEHYLRYGWVMGRDPSPLFSTKYYLQYNLDVANSQVNPFVHYVTQGVIEDRSRLPDAPDIQQEMPSHENLYVPLLKKHAKKRKSRARSKNKFS